MPLASTLATLATATQFENLPPDAVRIAKDAILDTVGVALVGSADPSIDVIRKSIGRSDATCSVWGTSFRTNALDAALLNATAGHVLDFDDCNDVYGGHPSVPIVPPLLALAEESGASGRELITAYVVGFEVECKIGRCDGYYQYSRGWHPTTTIGIFGAAAASARLLRLSQSETAHALAISASMASGIKANFGTVTKPLQVGNSARNGLFAAVLARNGCTANPAALEHEQGYFQTFNGPGHFRILDVESSWGSPFEVVEPGIAFKQYPCCGSTHPAIDALLPLRPRLRQRIERIDCAIHELCLRHTNRPNPAPGADSKFSLQYCLARAIVDGRIQLTDFTEERVNEPAIKALLPVIQVRPYAADTFATENYLGAIVDIELADGTRLSGRVDAPVGGTSECPLPPATLRQKFLDCAGQVLPSQRVEKIYELTMSMERQTSTSPMLSLLGL